jgi:hypothetical protein
LALNHQTAIVAEAAGRDIVERNPPDLGAFLRDGHKSTVDGKVPSVRRDFDNPPDHKAAGNPGPSIGIYRLK